MKILIGVAIAAVGVAGLAPSVWSRLHEDTPSMPPPPRLFPAAQVDTVDAATFAAARRAKAAADAWLARHRDATDASFSEWALSAMPKPPPDPVRKAELRTVEAAVATRSAERTAAALWLEQWGKKTVWKLYLKQAKPFLPPTDAVRAKHALKAALTLGATLTGTAKEQSRQPSPYEIDRKLAAINKAKFSGEVRYSYPSKHDVLSFAALAILRRVEPRRAAEFRWMADEVSYSRLVGGGHFPSDLVGGAYLGTLVGEYELHRAGI